MPPHRQRRRQAHSCSYVRVHVLLSEKEENQPAFGAGHLKIKDFTLPAVKILCLREPNEIVNVCWFYAVVVV